MCQLVLSCLDPAICLLIAFALSLHLIILWSLYLFDRMFSSMFHVPSSSFIWCLPSSLSSLVPEVSSSSSSSTNSFCRLLTPFFIVHSPAVVPFVLRVSRVLFLLLFNSNTVRPSRAPGLFVHHPQRHRHPILRSIYMLEDKSLCPWSTSRCHCIRLLCPTDLNFQSFHLVRGGI